MQAFGLPSIRTDVPRPDEVSIASCMNYGNEPTALELLFPTILTVDKAHWQKELSRDELRSVLDLSGICRIGQDTLQFLVKTWNETGEVT